MTSKDLKAAGGLLLCSLVGSGCAPQELHLCRILLAHLRCCLDVFGLLGFALVDASLRVSPEAGP